VLIDMTIAEIVLNDTLQFGVEWLFRGGPPNDRGVGRVVNALLRRSRGPTAPSLR